VDINVDTFLYCLITRIIFKSNLYIIPLHSILPVPILKRTICSIIFFSILKYYFLRIYKVFKFCYFTFRIRFNMNFFRHPVIQIKQDVSETGSLLVHRQNVMEAVIPPVLTQKNTVSVGLRD